MGVELVYYLINTHTITNTRLNQGDEYLRLLGLIRTDDIGNDNTISSQRIADARIIYGGQGAITDSNRMGWASRYFNSPWFPL